MDVKDYLLRMEIIRKDRLLSRSALAYESKISHQTILNLLKNPESCSLIIMQKLKAFVHKWENNNLSAPD